MIYTLVSALRVIFFMFRGRLRLFVHTRWQRENPQAVVAELCTDFARLVMRLTHSEVILEGRERVEGLPPDRRVVLISNHESNLDIPCVLLAVRGPVGFIAKKELSRIPFLRFWIKKLGGILLNRGDLRGSLETLSRAFGKADTRFMLVFPEGTRNRESTVAPFKAGSLRLAFENDALLLPVCVCGGRRKFEGNGYRIKPGKIYFRFLEPLDTRDLAQASRAGIAQRLHAEILDTYRAFDARLV